MRLPIVAAVLLFTLTAAAEAPKAYGACLDVPTVFPTADEATPELKRLDRLPSAFHIRTVDRRIGKCSAPVVVAAGIGTVPQR